MAAYTRKEGKTGRRGEKEKEGRGERTGSGGRERRKGRREGGRKKSILFSQPTSLKTVDAKGS